MDRDALKALVERTPDGAVADAVSDAIRQWEDEMLAEGFGDM